MVESTKQARLDNWAMFVMSRLQVFFNTTDYCDLTLQFEGNVQLKVHRVIMNACTEYFKLLEQECDMDGDILVMPPDLQADVILPIVNFMYTGILEYHYSIFERLYQTAELMNMTVLLKFLDAQRIKVRAPRAQQQAVVSGKRIIKTEKLPQMMPGRKLPIWKRKNAPMPVQINPVKPYSPEGRGSVTGDGSRFDNAPKPTRFEWPDDEIHDIKPFDLLPLDSSFDSISYSSKPLLTQEDEMRSSCNSTVFDDLRQLPGGKITKRVQELNRGKESYTLNSSVDMEDLKSYVKEQKIRSDLADYDDDDDPDDPDYVVEGTETHKRKSSLSPVVSKKAKISSEKENIVEVRTSSTKVDHSKIISEVIKKYPHLIQKNKNIRLKILAKNKHEEKAEKGVEKEQPKAKTLNAQMAKKSAKPRTTTSEAEPDATPKNKEHRDGEQVWVCTSCPNNGEPVEFVLYYLYRKHMTDAHHKQFDAKECKHCGEMYELPLQMVYHMYMAHAVAPPRNVVFPKCAQCSYIAYDADVMAKHEAFHAAHPAQVQCTNCKLGFSNSFTLKSHMQLAGHSGKNSLSFDCQYCTRQLNSASSLFVHCKTTHAEDAKRDGMLSVTEDHLDGFKAPEKVLPAEEKLPTSQIESSIGASLSSFDIVVLDDQQQFLIQGEQEATAQIANQQGFMALPTLQEQQYNIGQADIGSTDELVMVLTDHDYNDGTDDHMINNDNSNIVVLYSHPVDGQQNQFITSQGNIMLNAETGMLEIHNDGVPISTQSESIEMIQKEIQSHAMNNATSTTETVKVVPTPTVMESPPALVPTEEVIEMEVPDGQQETRPSHEDELGEKKKVIAIEKEGSGKLIDTIEEVEEDQTDCTDSFEQTKPEPMEIDEELQEQDASFNSEIIPSVESSDETLRSPAKENDPNPELEVATNIEPHHETPTESAEISLPQETSEVEQPPGQVSEEESKCIDDQPQLPIAEVVPQELLGSSTPAEIPGTPETSDTTTLPATVEPPDTGLVNPSAPDYVDDEYKTSASLSVSEQCPEEPMEVDGLVESKEVLQTETIDTVSDDNKADVADASCKSVTSNKSEENGEQPVIEREKIEVKSEDVVDGKVESAPLKVDDTEASPTTAEDNSNCVSAPSTDPTAETEPIKPAGGTQESASGDVIEEKPTLSATVDETNSLPDSIEKPLTDKPPTDEVKPADMNILPDSNPLQDSTSDAQLEKDKKELKNKCEGISTLLNDWEDTDSQTSEQGKTATVKKLINDWDDE